MKEFNWELPEKVEDKDADGKTIEKENPFTGMLVIRIPKYKERLQLLKSLNLKTGEKVETTGVNEDMVDAASKLADIAQDHVMKVAVTHKSSGKVFDSLDSLEYSREGTEVINTAANLVLSGLELGN